MQNTLTTPQALASATFLRGILNGYVTPALWPTASGGTLLSLVYKARQMQARKPEKPGFAVLMKGFLGTDLYKCLLGGDRLRFTSA